MSTIVNSQYARTASQVAYLNHWRFRVLGVGEPITEPVYNDGWWFTPATDIPMDGQDRIRALQRAGIPIKGVVIAHEAPRLLSAPQSPTKAPEAPTNAQSNVIITESDQVALINAFGAVLEGAFIVMALIFQAMLVDPALIVTLEDGTYLEVMTWLE